MSTTTEPTQNPPTTSHPKRKRKRKYPNHQTLTQHSLRPTWSYIHLRHLTSAPTPRPLDAVTAHLHLTTALSSFLGLHGTAIPIDVLNLTNQDVWIRVPAADRSALIAAVGNWVSCSGEGWRVKGWSHWSASALGRDAGRDLFED